MRELRTRCFQLKYDKGSVRWVKCNGTEIVRMIYAAVRDRNWGTVEPALLCEQIVQDEQGFQIDVRMEYLHNDIHFVADYRIAGIDNRLLFEMNGVAKSTFMTNRTGICMLHPVKECAGKPCRIVHPDNTTGTGAFPVDVSPFQPMKYIIEMEWEPVKGLAAMVKFSGDVFEMEDQRNWTDASFKTYCRPLDLPFPYEIREGSRVRQKVEMELKPESVVHSGAVNEIIFNVDTGRRYTMPAIGVGSTSRKESLTKREARILKSFPFDHLRGEVRLYEKEWKLQWMKLAGESLRLGIPLFLVLYFSENPAADLELVKTAAQRTGAKVKYVLIAGRNHLPDEALFDKVQKRLRTIFESAEVGAGVNAYYAELNRNRPRGQKADFINFTICPQVHAIDDASLVENLEGQKYAAESAGKLFPDKPVYVSPVTLRQRFNIVATAEEREPPQGALPPQVDKRQNTVFAAQWLAGSLKYLAQAGVSLVTYFETAGWRGFIQGDYLPPLPDKFTAAVGEIFPVFRLVKELQGFDEVLHSQSSSPLKVEGMVLQDGKTGLRKLILVNFDSSMHRIRLTGINFPEEYRLQTEEQGVHVAKDFVSLPAGGVIVFSSGPV